MSGALDLITLALDTATASPSAAILDGAVSVAELWLAPESGAGRRVLEVGHGLLGALGMDAGDLGRIVVGVGPGGFTGLRIGLATALGLGQSLGIPVVGAHSLEALALGIAQAEPGAEVVVPVLDARRRELFCAAYRVGPGADLTTLVPPLALAPDDLAGRVASLGTPAAVGGPGVDAAGDAFARAGVPVLHQASPGHRLRAALLGVRVEAGAGVPARPVYARLPDAEVNRLAALEAGGPR